MFHEGEEKRIRVLPSGWVHRHKMYTGHIRRHKSCQRRQEVARGVRNRWAIVSKK